MASAVVLKVLGGYEGTCGPDRPLALPTRKARALFAYLALHGERGTLEARWFLADEQVHMFLEGQQRDGEEAVDDGQQVDFVEFFAANPVGSRLFVDCILDDQPVTPGFLEGYQVQQVIDAVKQSHESGSRVMLQL